MSLNIRPIVINHRKPESDFKINTPNKVFKINLSDIELKVCTLENEFTGLTVDYSLFISYNDKVIGKITLPDIEKETPMLLTVYPKELTEKGTLITTDLYWTSKATAKYEECVGIALNKLLELGVVAL